jgi:hypothetical protein
MMRPVNNQGPQPNQRPSTGQAPQNRRDNVPRKP